MLWIKNNSEKAVDTYDQCVRAQVCLPDERGRKIMARITKRVKDNKGNPRGIENHTIFSYYSLIEVTFTNGRTEELTEMVMTENRLYEVYSEIHHYQVLNYISYHSVDMIALKKSNGFIRSRGKKLHAKKTTRGWKL